jgi:hypothetical protein
VIRHEALNALKVGVATHSATSTGCVNTVGVAGQ